MFAPRRAPLAACLSLLALGLAAQGTPLRGTVVDAATGAPVEFATVKLVAADGGAMLAGATTDLDGAFRLTADAPLGGLVVEVSFVGYSATREPLAGFADRPPAADGALDLGTLALAAEGTLLEEVVVRAEQSQTTFALDKRVFNVGKDLASTGASALDVLDNVPSVAVDIDGNVTLRGSQGVQMARVKSTPCCAGPHFSLDAASPPSSRARATTPSAR